MTNYNKSLDEILDLLEIESDMSADDSGNYWIEGKSEAKQAITSLYKELVAEAKPAYCDGSEKCSCSTQMEKYINSGKETAIIQFEQNLLKALEEV